MPPVLAPQSFTFAGRAGILAGKRIMDMELLLLFSWGFLDFWGRNFDPGNETSSRPLDL